MCGPAAVGYYLPFADDGFRMGLTPAWRAGRLVVGSGHAPPRLNS